MNVPQVAADERTMEAASLPNGPAAAALFSAGLGCALLGILSFAADAWKGVATLLTFYRPTGPLSGVTTLAIVVWLMAWVILAARWRSKTLNISKMNAATFVLIAIGLLLTFPPFTGILQGK
jgi:hypothetical protein